MAYHYHFSTIAEGEKGGTTYSDGVCVCKKPIRGDDDSYSDLKKQIAEQRKTVGDAPIAILSLTLINND